MKGEDDGWSMEVGLPRTSSSGQKMTALRNSKGRRRTDDCDRDR